MPDFPDEETAALLAKEEQGGNAPAFSVSEISSALKRTVEDRFGHVRVRGEISGFKRAASGHLYFSLKDADAKLDGVMWKGNAGRLPFAPEDGLEVIATGKLTTYAGRSSYQIVADRLELAGEGALMLLFEKLKARLSAEGLFEPTTKTPYSLFAQNHRHSDFADRSGDPGYITPAGRPLPQPCSRLAGAGAGRWGRSASGGGGARIFGDARRNSGQTC